MKALLFACRPKTLTASIVPVIVGAALAYHDYHRLKWTLLVMIFFSAGFIQIGTNLFNDALDFLKGADTVDRLGPARATQQGWMKPRQVMGLAAACFLLALACGIPLVWVGRAPILIIGVVSLLMGYCYTGGPYPLAYKGLGDFFVLIFFGWIAVGGTYYLMSDTWTLSAFVAGTQIGLLGVVLIAINNLRDQECDQRVGKNTLSVRLGEMAHWEITFLIIPTFLLNLYWLEIGLWKAAFFPLLVFPFAWQLNNRLRSTLAGPVYNIYLSRAAKIQLGFGALISLGLCLS